MNLYPLISLLQDGKYQTGTRLGEQLGISRAAVWKQIQQLDKYGLEVKASKADGYALACPLDLLDISKLEALFEGGKNSLCFEFVPVIDSTNLEMHRQLDAGRDIHGKVITTEMQIQGKGRRGKQWVVNYSQSLTFSIAWKFSNGVKQLQGISLAISVLVKQVLDEMGAQGVELKWPNDVYIDGAKLAGILIEVTGDFTGECNLVLGVGINIDLPSNNDITQLAGYLNKDIKVNRTELLINLVLGLQKLLEEYPKEGFKAWQKAWNAAHIWHGEQANLIRGDKIEQVTLGTVNERGELKVTYADATEAYISGGEISIRKLM